MTRKVLKKLALSATSLAVVIVVAELVARAAEPGPFSFFDRRPYERVEGLPHTHKANFGGRWDGTWYGTNSHGMRGGELDLEFSENEYRVIALGDSCTFGKGVLESDTWPRQLESMLAEELAPKFRPVVANLGVNGYSGKHYLKKLEDYGPQVRPDLIVIGYNLNDFPNVIKEVDQKVFQRPNNLRGMIPADMRDFLGRFALFRWMRAQYYAMNRDKAWSAAERMAAEVQPANEDQAARFERETGRIQRMAEVAESLGAPLVLFLFPYESQVYLDVYDTSAIEWLRKTCEERGILFVDMAGRFREVARQEDPPKPLFLRGDRYHPRPEGYSIVARAVLELTRGQGWLPAVD